MPSLLLQWWFLGSKFFFEFLRLLPSIFGAPSQSLFRCPHLRATVVTVTASMFSGFVFDPVSSSPSCLADTSRCLSCLRSKGICVFWRMTSRKCSSFSACPKPLRELSVQSHLEQQRQHLRRQIRLTATLECTCSPVTSVFFVNTVHTS